ncbi:MAG: SdrD B-like domain-containing protein [Ardenticatenaceae bacterium]|nr:SdrD B-like domain-containing protein [Ardenticatenaceae bacterium]
MKHFRFFSFVFLSIIVSIILFGTAGSTSAAPGEVGSETAVRQESSSPSAQEAVELAWELAYESGSYAFRTNMLQTTVPANSLENAGRDNRQDRIYVEGEADRLNEELLTKLWRAGFEEQAVSMRVVNGKSYGRVGLNEWEEVDGYTDMFAPAGDPMAFLAGAVNIQLGDEETRSFTKPDGSDLTLSFTRYTFDVDGQAFAQYVRDDMEAALRASGELPNGISLGVSDHLKEATGQGEIWINPEGLPSYLAIDLELPRQPNGDEITARIQTEFMDYDMARLTAAQTGLVEDPSVWFTHRLPATIQNDLIASAILLFAFMAIALWAYQHWDPKVIYRIVVLVVTGTMVAGPLLQSTQVHAFYDAQFTRQTENQAVQEEARENQEIIASQYESDFDPHSNPLDTPSDYALQKEFDAQTSDPFTIENYGLADVSAVTLQSSTPITSTDTDNDGLSDADEDFWDSCAYLGAPTNCSGVTDSTDTDGDGLSDGDEVNFIGTEPAYEDTDGDGISDFYEVTGFTDSSGVMWYLDPRRDDSNRDGIADGSECPTLAAADTSFDPTKGCADTDGDGTPDIFDGDNDNDNISDDIDLSPYTPPAGNFSGDKKFKVNFQNLTIDTPTYVDMQIVPADSHNLTLFGNVYDWPSGDREGQIQRVLDTTFANAIDTNNRSSAANAGDGDVRIVPFLEIYIPYEAGHYGNLPVKTAFEDQPRTLGTPVSQWLDDSELSQFGIGVTDADATSGDLQVLVPLNIVTSDRDNSPVAFSAKMFYYPEQGTSNVVNWGKDHEMRLVWMVQMLTDNCPQAKPNCTDAERVESLQVIHVYDDQWRLGGISASQDYGLDVALLYEDPAIDTDRTTDDFLWASSAFLSNAFIRGIDCPVITNNGLCDSSAQDGRRDVTLANAVTAIDTWSGGISNIAGKTFSYDHEAYLTHIWITETVALLDEKFTPYQNNANETVNPTIMTLKEGTKQTVNLDATAQITDTVTSFDFDDTKVPKLTVVSMNWATYYDADATNEVKWAKYDLESYLTLLDYQLQTQEYFQAASNSLLDADAAEGKRLFVQLYYQAMYRGAIGMVETDGKVAWVESSEIKEAGYEPGFPTATWKGTVYVSLIYLLSAGSALKTKIQNSSTAFWANFKSTYSFLYNNALADYARFSGYKTKLAFAGAFATAHALIVIGAALVLAGYITGNEVVKKVGIIVLNVSSVIVLSMFLSTLSFQLASAGLALNASFKSLTAIAKGFQLFGVIPFIFTVVLSLTFAGIAAGLTGAQAGSIEFTLIWVSAVAQIIVGLLLLVITLSLGWIGALISLIILLVDAALAIFGQGGFQEWLTNAIAKAIYKTDLLVHNLSDGNRLGIGFDQVRLSNPEQGFVVGNSLLITSVVTSTLDVRSRVDIINKTGFDETFFKYSLTQDPVLEKLSINDGSPEIAALINTFSDGRGWKIVEPAYHQEPIFCNATGDFCSYLPWHYIRNVQNITNTQAIPLSAVGSGVNRTMEGEVWLNEYFRVFYEGCWKIAWTFGCTFYPVEDNSTIPIGEYLVFDVLPNTVTEFSRVYAWDNHPSSVAFPIQTDLDNDGLLSITQGGTDTNDGLVDSDGDKLSDPFELARGLNEGSVDTDGDGLNDYDEFVYETNPLSADSDGDGLTDYTEVVTGWLVPINAAATSFTRVWSNPNLADEDNDSLTDLEELTFATNPYVPTDPSILRTFVTFEGLGVAEKSTPIVYLPFEETGTGAFFSDVSGFGLRFECNQAGGTCPTADQPGQIGRAADFSPGDNITLIGQEVDLDTEVTLAAWINPDALSSIDPIINIGDQDAVLEISANQLVFTIKINGLSESVIVPGVVQTGVYQHVAGTYDGTTMRLYLNGSEVGSTPVSGAINHRSGFMTIGVAPINETFDGRIDEVAVFEAALSETEISGLMVGRYESNDLIIAPGAELSYGVTVTNSHPVLNAAGRLAATSQYAQPAIPDPEMVLNFEPDEYIITVPNSSGEGSQVNCIGDGSCPTSTAGKYGRAIEFDGQNDVLSLPPFIYGRTNATVAFWIKIDALPAANQRMTIIDTVRSADGAPVAGDVDVWLDSSGYLWFDIEGDTPNSLSTSCSTGNNGDNCGTIDSSWTQPHRSDTQLVAGADYVHVLWSGSKLYINGDFDSWYISNGRPNLHVGPGTFGNNNASTSDLDGAIDELAIYQQIMDRDESNIDRVLRVFNGDYYMFGGGVSDSIPVALYDFNEYQAFGPSVANDTFENAAGDPLVCASLDTCPALVSDGQVGDSIDFDGANDSLPFVAKVNQDTVDITMYVKPHTLPAANQVSFLIESEYVSFGSAVTPANFGLNNQGQLLHVYAPDLDPTQFGQVVSDFNFGSALNQWTKIQFAFATNRTSGCFYELTVTVDDDTNNAKETYLSDCGGSVLVGNGRLGSRLDGTGNFDGQIDEFKVTYFDDTPGVNETKTLYDVSFVAPKITTEFGWLDSITRGRTAFCETAVSCPDHTVAGKYGNGVAFDGADDYLFANEVALNNRSFTLAGWFKRDSVGRYDFLVHQGILANNQGLHFGFLPNNQFTCAFYGNDLNTAAYTDTEWHHWACTYDVDSNTRTIYRDGVQVAQDNPSSPYLGSGVIQIGRATNGVYTDGTLDDLYILPDALDRDGIAALMTNAYPAITFPNPFVTFTAGPRTSVYAEGTAQVASQVTNSQHTFDTEVDVGLQTQPIPYPVVDNNSGNLIMYMPFDDLPLSTSFDNVIGVDMSCMDSDTERCPEAGLRGRVNRTVYFDGTSDLLYSGNGLSADDGMTIAAWVKADRGTVFSAGPMELDIGRVGLRNMCRTPNDVIPGLVFEEFSFDMPENEWVHVAATISKSSGTASVYVNGVPAGTFDSCLNDYPNNALNTTFFTDLTVGGNTPALGFDPLLGYVDDLRVYNAELNQAAVQNLFNNSAAVMQFEFDEGDEATAYIDATQNGYVGIPTLITATPAPVYDPSPGTKGQIGNTALFNGGGSITVADAAPNINFSQDFTIMTWINTTASNVKILTETDGDAIWETGEKAFYIDPQGKLVFNGFANGVITTDAAVNDGLWKHVAFTWSSTGNTPRMYINGKLVGSSGFYVANQEDIATNIIKIGAAAHGFGNFDGQLDELAIYQRALTQDEMRNVYSRELIWYRDTASTIITVDADNPIVRFLSGTYHDNMPIDLVFSAVDATSDIQQVQFGLKAPSASDYTWTIVEPCESQAALFNSAIYCVEIDPSSGELDGEGKYDLKLRAYDAVGNMSELTDFVYVDDTAPVVTTQFNGEWVAAVEPDDNTNSWTVTIEGTATDPNISGGFPGSGLANNGQSGIAVTVYNEWGDPVGDGPQQGLLNQDGSWSVDYRFLGLPPQGRFVIEGIVLDQVGNQSAAFTLPIIGTANTFRMDEQPAEPEINLWNMSENITGTFVISGTVVDQLDPASAVVQYRFEEQAGATIFYDSSGENAHGLCDQCPTAGVAGKYGQAAGFDNGKYITVTGTDDAITDTLTSGLNPISNTFSVATWVNLEAIVNPQTILSQQDGTGTGTDWLWVDANGYLSSSLGNAALHTTAPLTINEWYHVALTYDGTDLSLYINGTLAAIAAESMTAADGNWLVGISKDGVTAPLFGQLDEFIIADQPLSVEEIRALAEADVSGVATTEVWLEPFTSFTETIGIPVWENATLIGNVGDKVGQWQYAIPDNLEGFHRIHLRGGDATGNGSGLRTVWSGVIDTAAPAIDFTAQIVGEDTFRAYEYTIDITDFALVESRITHPCDDADLTYSYYDRPGQPLDGLAYAAYATCRVPVDNGNPAAIPSITVKACDALGNCSEVTRQPSPIGVSNLVITAPTDGSSAPFASPFTISGGIVTVEEQVLDVAVTVNGVVIGNFLPTIDVSGTWSTDLWTPSEPGPYTITVEAQMSSGNSIKDTVVVELIPSESAAPTAVDDVVVTTQDTTTTIDVLVNDSDPDGDPISLVSLTQPQNGTAAISGSQVVYTPTAGYTGADSFTYTIQDDTGLTSSATVSVTVNDPAIGQIEVAVWDDQNGDGKKQNDEPPINGVVINLLDAGTNEVIAAGISADGLAVLPSPAGTYRIEAVKPDGHAFTLYNKGSNENIDSDVRRNNGRSATFTLAADQLISNIDVGLWSPATVQAEVWDDQNGDGKKQAGEPLIMTPVMVKLLDSGNNELQAAETISGVVTFTGVPADTLVKLEFAEPSGYALTQYNKGSNENIDSDARRSNGRTDTFKSTKGAQLISNMDAGYWSPASVQAQIWDDRNGDGKRQSNEPLITTEVTVNLLDSSNALLQTTKSVNGLATFTGIPADTDVKLEFVLPQDHAFTLYNQGGNEAIDSDARRTNGRTDVFKSSRGAQLITNMDVGLWSPGQIEAETWDDQNGDGKRQNGEPPVTGITVALLYADNTPVIDPATSEPVTGTSDVAGIALLSYVPADVDVKLEFVDSVNGYPLTQFNKGSNENIDSDARRTNGRTDTFRTSKGAETITNMDAGFWSPATVQAEIWDDLNGDGKKQNGEPLILIPVTVNLLDAGNNLIQTTTSVDGVATFTGVPADTEVKLEFVLPNDHAFTLFNQGRNETIDSDARRSNGRTDTFKSNRGAQLITHVDAGLWSPGQVEAEVWLDANGDGKQQNSEAPIAGVTTNLLYANNTPVLDPDGNPVTAVTDSSGVATLSYVPADVSVKLEFDAPDGYDFTLYNQGNNERIDSDARRSNGRTNPFKTTKGQHTITDWDAGLLTP